MRTSTRWALALSMLTAAGCTGGSGQISASTGLAGGSAGSTSAESTTSGSRTSAGSTGAQSSSSASGSTTGNSGPPTSGASSGGSSSTNSSTSGTTTGASTVQVPGPSPDLFAHPYYSCQRNFYVSPNGSDSAHGTSVATAWRTLQHADDQGPVAGDCINVQPGTYPAGVTLAHGGNAATSTGYVVYRCSALDACKITAAGFAAGAFYVERTTFPMPNYFVIDGFELAAASSDTYGCGVDVEDGYENSPTALNASHHLWVLNNIIHGYGQSGLQMNDGEYYYALHNTVYGNSHVTCDAQGSGISLVVLKAFANYTPTDDDRTNPNPLIGSWITGSAFFHNVVEWNVVFNNALTACGTSGNSYDTDGNNIIMDTLNNHGTTNVVYPNPTLVAFNVVYNAGGGGVHLTNSEFVTVANNSCYNNYLDPYNNGSSRACIDASASYGNTFLNNIAVALPASHPGGCQYTVPPYAMWNNPYLGSPPSASDTPDSFVNNLSYVFGGPSCQGDHFVNNGDSYSCTDNLCDTDPQWVDVGTADAGTETTPPAGVNFALRLGSPAIDAGQTAPYLPPQSVDLGACAHSLTTCP